MDCSSKVRILYSLLLTSTVKEVKQLVFYLTEHDEEVSQHWYSMDWQGPHSLAEYRRSHLLLLVHKQPWKVSGQLWGYLPWFFFSLGFTSTNDISRASTFSGQRLIPLTGFDLITYWRTLAPCHTCTVEGGQQTVRDRSGVWEMGQRGGEGVMETERGCEMGMRVGGRRSATNL